MGNQHKSINTQYDEGDLARDYHFESERLKEKDPGRSFLYSHMESVDRNGIVLDLGCGSGIDLAEYKKMGFANLIGIDPSEKILEEAKNLNPDTSFKVGTFDSIPLPDNSVDIIVSRHALHYSKDISQALKEVCRVLKPIGIFMAVVSNPRFDSTLVPDVEGNIRTTLFNGGVKINFPRHFIEEYFSPEFYNNFELLEEFEYNGSERDDYMDGKNNTLFFVAKKKINPGLSDSIRSKETS